MPYFMMMSLLASALLRHDQKPMTFYFQTAGFLDQVVDLDQLIVVLFYTEVGDLPLNDLEMENERADI